MSQDDSSIGVPPDVDEDVEGDGDGVFACRPRVNSGRYELGRHRNYEPYLGTIKNRSLAKLDETILRYASSGGGNMHDMGFNPPPSAPPASVTSSSDNEDVRHGHGVSRSHAMRCERLCEETYNVAGEDEEECKEHGMYDDGEETSEGEMAELEGTRGNGFFPPVSMRIKRGARRPASANSRYDDEGREQSSWRQGKKAKTYHGPLSPERKALEKGYQINSMEAAATFGSHQSSQHPRLTIRGYTMVDWLDAYLEYMTDEEKTARAAMYLSDAIDQRPARQRKRGIKRIWAYRFCKQRWWQSSIVLLVIVHLLLAIWEPPQGLADGQSYFYSPAPDSELTRSFASGLLGFEFLILLIYTVDVGLEVYALGVTDFFGPGTHSLVVPGARVKATVRASRWGQLKCFILVVFFADVVAGMTGDIAIRFSRYFRPVYLVCCWEPLRRWAVHVGKTVYKLRDLVLCVGIVLSLYSLMALILFSEVTYYTDLPFQNFRNIFNSFIALYVLITTQNYSEMVYPAYNSDPYHNSELFFFFFATFVVVFVLFLANLGLPKIYWTLKVEQRKQALESRLLERFALLLSFRCVDCHKRGFINLDQFRNLLRSYRGDLFDPQTGYERDVYMGVTDWMFEKMANVHPGRIAMDEFFSICEVIMTKFDPAVPPLPQEALAPAWHQRERARFRGMFQSRWAEIISLVALLLTMFFLAFYGSPYFNKNSLRNFSYFMIFAFSFEVTLKLWAFGWSLFFSKAENILDASIMSAALFSSLVYFFSPSSSSIKHSEIAANTGLLFLTLRGIRLFPKFEMFHKFSAAFKVFPFFLNTTALALLFLYAWAILGMQLFAYKSTTTTQFDNFYGSFVTLFQVAATHDWHQVMYGWMGICSSWWVSLYFIIFHLVCLVVMFQLTTALFIDAFLSFDDKRWVESSDNLSPDMVPDGETLPTKANEALVTETLRKRFEVEYADERRPTSPGPAIAAVV